MRKQCYSIHLGPSGDRDVLCTYLMHHCWACTHGASMHTPKVYTQFGEPLYDEKSSPQQLAGNLAWYKLNLGCDELFTFMCASLLTSCKSTISLMCSLSVALCTNLCRWLCLASSTIASTADNCFFKYVLWTVFQNSWPVLLYYWLKKHTVYNLVVRIWAFCNLVWLVIVSLRCEYQVEAASHHWTASERKPLEAITVPGLHRPIWQVQRFQLVSKTVHIQYTNMARDKKNLNNGSFQAQQLLKKQ